VRKTSLWENPVDIDDFASLSGTNESISAASTIIYFGRIDRNKGLDLLISALSRIAANYRLQIVGRGDARYVSELQELAELGGVKVDFLGYRANGE
jgi:glycosyltransferase involved in cell wall biosynthesis